MMLSQSRHAKDARNESHPAQFLPYLRHVDDYTIKTRKTQYIRIFELRGQHHETAGYGTINSWHIALNNLLRGLASPRIALWSYMIREDGGRFPEGVFPDAYSQGFNDRYAASLSRRRVFVNRFFLAIVLGQEGSKVERRLSFFNRPMQSKGDRALQQTEDLELLEVKTRHVLSGLQGYNPHPLKTYVHEGSVCSEPAEFLARLYDNRWRRVPLRQRPLNETLATARTIFGREIIELRHAGGSQYGGIIGINDYGETSGPGFINTLNRLDFPLIAAQSFTFETKNDAISAMKRQMDRLDQVDDEALSQRDALGEAIDDVISGRIAMGQHHLSVAVYSDPDQGQDPKKAVRQCTYRVGEVVTALSDATIIGVRESLVSEGAFWAQFPGNHSEIPRASMISTRNFAGFSSFHGEAVGQFENNYWGDCVTVLQTEANTPHYFNFHVGGVGHALVAGMTESGKTVILCVLAAQSRKYGGRLVFFDKDRGAEIFLRAIGGHYSVIRRGVPTGFNPLQMEPTKANVDFMKAFVRHLVTAHSPGFSVAEESAVDAAIETLIGDPVRLHERSLSTLAQALDADGFTDVAGRLKPWFRGGRYGWAFDNPEDLLDMRTSKVLGFDMTEWIDDEILRGPMLAYLLYRTKECLDGGRLQIFLDEAWKPLGDELFAEQIKDWLLTVRKANAMLVLSTQSPASLSESPVSKIIIQQIATLILAANPAASEEQYIDYLKLNRTEFEMFRSISKGSFKFMVKHSDEHDAVIAKLDLRGMEDDLAVMSGTKSSVLLLDEIREEVGDDPSDWLPVFLERRHGVTT